MAKNEKTWKVPDSEGGFEAHVTAVAPDEKEKKKKFLKETGKTKSGVAIEAPNSVELEEGMVIRAYGYEIEKDHSEK